MNDNVLARAIIDALDEEYAEQIPARSTDHVFSKSFEKKMRKLIRRRKKPYYKIISTAGRRAACVTAIVAAASVATVTNADALRQAFEKYSLSVFHTHSDIAKKDGEEVKKTPDTIEREYGITEGLDGYKIDYEESNSFSKQINYVNEEKGTAISFCQYVISDFNMSVNTESSQMETVDINGFEAIYLTDNHNFCHLMWDNGEYVFYISSNTDKDELIMLAQSVKAV